MYRVPKETAPAFARPFDAQPAQPHVHWTLPAGWVDKGASGMRVGSFTIAGPNGQSADVSVIPLSGWAGRELENVNRWRAQVGMSPVTAEELPKLAQAVAIGGGAGQLFEMAGEPVESDKPLRIYAAVLPAPGLTWFFKMTGDDALVKEQKAAFTAFLKSVHFDEEEHGHPDSSAPAAPAAATSGSGASDKPAWTLPPGWEEQPAGALQLARFLATDKTSGNAEVAVSVLGGDGGGLLANVNRWRQQIGLAPVTQEELGRLVTPLDPGSPAAMLVDMTTESKQSRVVAAIVPRGGQTWFFKLTGRDEPVGRQREAFVQFVKSVR